jgi:hypothetical protein
MLLDKFKESEKSELKEKSSLNLLLRKKNNN